MDKVVSYSFSKNNWFFKKHGLGTRLVHIKRKKIFDSDEWMKIRVIWDISKRIDGNKSIVFYINKKEIAFCKEDIPEDIPFMNYISIGMSAADHFMKDKETGNMYQNACGVIDELYIWNYPRIKKTKNKP